MTEKNGRLFKYVGIGTLITLATILVTVGLAWGTLGTELEHTQDRVEEVRTENIEKNTLQDMQIKAIEIQSGRIDERLISIDKGIGALNEKLK